MERFRAALSGYDFAVICVNRIRMGSLTGFESPWRYTRNRSQSGFLSFWSDWQDHWQEAEYVSRMHAPQRAVSNSAASEAGHKLFRQSQDSGDFTDEMMELLETVVLYLAQFGAPRVAVTERLTDLVGHVCPHHIENVSSRAKTISAIDKKMRRRTSMRLAQMEDIAGCRAVLDTADDVKTVLDMILKEWPGSHIDDYVKTPRKPTGYRAIHVVVEQDGFKVEIQLRTLHQNQWADEVEKFADRFGLDQVGNSLKDGEAPSFIVRYFERTALVMATKEKGGSVGLKLEKELSELRENVRQFIRVNLESK